MTEKGLKRGDQMKRASTTVSVIVAVVVLLAAFGVGLCIREIRFRRARVKSKSPEIQKPSVATALETNRPPIRPMPGPGGPDRNPGSSAEQRAGVVDERADMKQRFENMSEEEREAFRAQMRDRFGGGRRRGGGEMPQNLSEEQRTQLRADMESMRDKWETMSEEERQTVMAQMREKYGFTPRMGFGGRPGGGPDGGEGARRRPGERPGARQ